MPSRNTLWVISKNSLYKGIVVEKCIIFLCLCNKLPQTWLLKGTKIYAFTVLEYRNPKLVSLC